ncbi:hypothetical protein [Nocardia vermiculata]|uniref:Uncharacterized protein n=1 Tax=Nocardia vermiculata TaxID=257274 RepID=A0A846Y2Z1_9NOCA|nr:hypothetical protein [Nocardia vermiculata]NKY53197.1 hypothetical protein [Nocardia vermiculata]
MKRLLIVVAAVIAAGSVFDYARTPGHLGVAVAAGVVGALWLAAKAVE